MYPVSHTWEQKRIPASELTQPELGDVFGFSLCKHYKDYPEKENLAVIDNRSGFPVCTEEVGVRALEQ